MSPLCRSVFATLLLHKRQTWLRKQAVLQSQMMLPSQWSHHSFGKSCNSIAACPSHVTFVSQPCQPYVAAFLTPRPCMSDNRLPTIHKRAKLGSQIMLPSQWSRHDFSNSRCSISARHSHVTLVSQPCHPYVAAFLKPSPCMIDNHLSTIHK